MYPPQKKFFFRFLTSIRFYLSNLKVDIRRSHNLVTIVTQVTVVQSYTWKGSPVPPGTGNELNPGDKDDDKAITWLNLDQFR
jgi:hypothetical protein